MLNSLLYGDSTYSGDGSDAPSFPGDDSEELSANEILYANGSRLIYKDGFSIELWTEWQFLQESGINENPRAFINGECVCTGHATTHIVPYLIARKNFSGRGSMMTMVIKMYMDKQEYSNDGWNPTAECLHRLWAGANTYAAAKAINPKHCAEKSGTCGGGACFKITYDLDKDDYVIVPM